VGEFESPGLKEIFQQSERTRNDFFGRIDLDSVPVLKQPVNANWLLELSKIGSSSASSSSGVGDSPLPVTPSSAKKHKKKNSNSQRA
jgi:hypothetical protein